MTRLSHIEINVSDYSKSIRFYNAILMPLGWQRLVCAKDCTTYSDGAMKLILSPTEEKYKKDGFHRKRVGLNQLQNGLNLLIQFTKQGHQIEVDRLTRAHNPIQWKIVDDPEDFILKKT